MKKVLVVAEKPFFIDLLAEHGAVTGLFGVLNAENSAKAVAILESILIDVVVTDLELPDVDGFELLLTVSQRFPNLPVVALTSASQRELRARLETSAAIRFHSKPVNLEVLINEICDSMDAAAANQRSTPIELGTTLQLLEACRRTCMLRVKVGESPAGFCFLRDGVLFQAFTPTTKGEDALQQLVRSPGVNLGFARIPDKNIPRGIELDVTTLLRRAGVLKRFEEDELDALAGAAAPPPIQRTSRFQPVPDAGEDDDEAFPPVAPIPAMGKRTTRRGHDQTAPKKLTTGRRSAFEQWQESTASRLGPRNMPTQPFLDAEGDDEDDLLEVLGAPPKEPIAAGPYVRGRGRSEQAHAAGVYLPPEDSNVMHDVSKGPRAAGKASGPPPLPKALPPKMPPRVEIIHDEEEDSPPALAGVNSVTPLELMFDGPIELEMPPAPHELGPIELDLDHLELLDVPPPPPPFRNDYAPALLPPVPLPPVAFDLGDAAPPAPSETDALRHAPGESESAALAPTEHAMAAVALPTPPATADGDQSPPQGGHPDNPPGNAEPTELLAAAPWTKSPLLSAKAQRLVAKALAAANDVVGLSGVAMVSGKSGILYSTLGPLADDESAALALPALMESAVKLCRAVDGSEASCVCLRCQEGRICYLPLRVLPSQLPARTDPAALGLVMFLAPDGETVLAFHRLRQAEMLLVETLQDSQEEALWLPLL